MLVKLHAIMWLQGMFSKLGFPILTTYCGANFVPWWLGSFWYFLIDLIPGSSLALNCYAMYVRLFFLVWYFTEYHSLKKSAYIYTYAQIHTHTSIKYICRGMHTHMFIFRFTRIRKVSICTISQTTMRCQSCTCPWTPLKTKCLFPFIFLLKDQNK